jgi:DNA-binding CsgD family transcriptional regulator
MTPFPQEPDMPPTSESPPGPDGGVRPPLRERIWTRIEHEVDTRSIRLAADLIRRTEGRVGRLFRRRVLVLTTQGRKSGQMRTVPLQYLDASAPSSRTHRLSSSPPIATTSRCWPPSLPERSVISPKTPVATTSVARSPPPGAVKPCSLLDPRVHARIVQLAQRQPAGSADGSLPDGLTVREAEVLAYISRGLSYQEIAASLFVSEATVKTHINRIFAKTQSRDRAQAIAYAHHHGLT